MSKVIAIGPMSSEVVEAVYRYSHITHKPFMLISSMNQIDHNGGYVNKWTTQDYMKFIRTMRLQYQDSDVLICRDHCGPGFNGRNELGDAFMTISEDIKAGYDLIHIDFCHFKGPRDKMLTRASEAIEYAKKKNPRIRFEIGTDEIGKPLNLNQVRAELDYFTKFCNPEYYVINTGSLVLEDKQVGIFNQEKTQQAWRLLRDYNIKLKEHNADYLTAEQIRARKSCVDALNIAPQLGVRQTERILSLAQKFNINANSFLESAYKSKKWKKWLQYTSPDDTYTCSVLAGHYVFSGNPYNVLYKNLNHYVDVKEELINAAIETIDHYATNFYN